MTKRIKNFINRTLWGLVFTYVAFLTLIHLTPVQNFLGREVASALSKKLGTEVSVGRVDLGFLNRIVIDNVSIMDQQRQQMVTAKRMAVKMELLPLLKGRVYISSAQLFGADFNLYKENEKATPNYQFALDSLASKDTLSDSHIDLKINMITIRHSSLAYNQNDVFQTPGKLNPKHLMCSDISAYISVTDLQEDSLNVRVKRLSFKEQSGLEIVRFDGKVEAGKSHGTIRDMQLTMPHSTLHVNNLEATYDKDHFQETVRFQADLDGTRLTPSDFSFLYPPLHAFTQTLALDTRLTGSAKRLATDRLTLTASDHSIEVKTAFDISQEHGDTQWHAQLQRLNATEELVAQLRETFPDIPEELTRLGQINLTGEAKGKDLKEAEGYANISTDAGHVQVTFAQDSKQNLNCHAKTDDLQIGRILDNAQLGTMHTDITLDGNRNNIHVAGTLPLMEYNGYAYHDINIDGTWQHEQTSCNLRMDDPNLKLDITGSLTQHTPKEIQLNGTVERLAPQALHLSDQWGTAVFSGQIEADIKGNTLNDAVGAIHLSDLCMAHDGTDDYRIGRLDIHTGYDDGIHRIYAAGDMGEVELTGVFDIGTLQQSIVNYTANMLPTLPGLPQKRSATANNFVANINLNDTRWMQRLLNIPLSIDQPVQLSMAVNDHDNQLSVNGQMPDFTYDEGRYLNGEISLTTEDNKAKWHAEVVKVMDDDARMQLTMNAQAANNKLNATLWMNNKTPSGHDISGEINIAGSLYTNDLGKSEAHIQVEPSQIIICDTAWTIQPAEIRYTEKRLDIDHFKVERGQRHLMIDGVASASPADLLTVDLNEMEVAYILDLVNFHSVDFSGQATGKAYATQLFGDVNAWTDLTVNQFLFENGHMGTLHAKARWNRTASQIDIDAVAEENDSARTLIYGYVSPSRNDIHLDIKAENTNIGFCNSFASSFMDHVEGRANGLVTLSGLLSRIYLTGGMTVDGKATVTALNTTYQMKGDSIMFKPDEIAIDHCPVTDRYGNKGFLTGSLRHRSFKHFTFDLDVDANHLLAYDFPDFNDDIICGKVYATGNADLHGVPGEVVINCNVTPNQGSFFAYNAANPEAVSQQNFITFRNAAELQDKHRQTTAGQTDDDGNDSRSDIYINFTIHATPESTLRVLMDPTTGDYVSLNGNGDIKATFYNKGPFQMFGTYTVDHGTYGITIQEIIKKNFAFQEGGTIVFGGDPYDAGLNLQALYTVNGVSLSDLNMGNSFSNSTVRVNCLMNISGTPGTPRVEFDLDMPNVNSEEKQMIRSLIDSEQEINQQVLYLLGVGRFYAQGSNNADTQDYDQTSLAMQSFLSGTVSTQINQLLSQIVNSNDWSFGANISTGNEGWHNAEYEGTVSGRMLNNRLLINGQFGYRDNAAQASPSFIGDFDIRYLLNPNGSLALKAYNQTNDRYFTKSSLNTQGIGIIMKKDFNGLRDLFHVRKRLYY